jgi:hypothetical protein
MKHHRTSLTAALAAFAALGASAAITPTPTVVAGSGSAVSISKEYVDPRRTQKEKKKKVRIGSGNGKEPWQWDKHGNARDSVSNYRSSKRLRRMILTAIVGVPNTGRQWRNLQKKMRVIAPAVLTAHPLTLLKHARAA